MFPVTVGKSGRRQMSHRVSALEARLKALNGVIEAVSQEKITEEVIGIIHRPGWTTVDETALVQKMNHNKKPSNRKEEVSKFRLPDVADPRDGVRLIKAFLEIKEPALREKLMHLAEDLARASSDRLGTAEVEENHKRAFRGFDVLANPAEDDAAVPAEMP
jgi:hypothetical protein